MNTHLVIDVDGHVLEPLNLWKDYLEDESYLPLAPRFVDDDNGQQTFMLEGRTHGRRGLGTGGRNKDSTWDKNSQKQRWEDQEPGGFNPHARIADMDAEGVDITLLYPTIALRFTGIEDHKLAAALCRAYNKWLADYCRPFPERLFGMAAIPLQSPEDAVIELRFASEKLKLKGAFIRPNALGGRNLDHPDFYPVWQTAEKLGIPIGIHEGGFMKSVKAIGTERFDNIVMQHMVNHPMEAQMACMSLIMGGVLEKFPALTIILLESGAGWLPYWLERMDEHHERMGWLIPECKLAPSEYFRRQCAIQIESDESTLPMVISMLGDSNILWGSDYPHFDCNWTGAVQRIRNSSLPKETLENILSNNAFRFFNLST